MYSRGNKSVKLAVCSQFSIISPQIKSHTSSPCSYQLLCYLVKLSEVFITSFRYYYCSSYGRLCSCTFPQQTRKIYWNNTMGPQDLNIGILTGIPRLPVPKYEYLAFVQKTLPDYWGYSIVKTHTIIVLYCTSKIIVPVQSTGKSELTKRLIRPIFFPVTK